MFLFILHLQQVNNKNQLCFIEFSWLIGLDLENAQNIYFYGIIIKD